MREGQGKLSLGNKKYIYNGAWKDNLPCGEGEFKNNEEDSLYKGQAWQGKAHGKGVYTVGPVSNPLYVYDGDWANNRRHGHGVEMKY